MSNGAVEEIREMPEKEGNPLGETVWSSQRSAIRRASRGSRLLRSRRVQFIAFAVALAMLGVACSKTTTPEQQAIRRQDRAAADETPIPFNRGKWLSQSRFDVEGSPRWRMYEDLIANHLPLGLAKAKVLSLLGPSQAGVYDSTVHQEASQDGVSDIASVLAYPMVEDRPDASNPIDSPMTTLLVVTLGKSERVTWRGIIAE